MTKNIEADTTIKQNVRDFVVEYFLFGDALTIPEEASFLENGIIDSMGFLELITYLENTYGIQIADDELIPDNMDSLTNVSSFMIRKLGADSN